MKITHHALKLTPVDKRDFSLGAITTLPELVTLPKSFMLDGIRIKNQRDTDFCTQFSSCGASELQEGVELSPEWTFAKTKQLNNDLDSYGEDLRTAMATHTKVGAVEAKDVPFSVNDKDPAYLRHIENYPQGLEKKAVEHMKNSYLKVTGPYDAFDNIRATLFKYREERRAVVMGCIFGWDTNDVVFDTVVKEGGGHAMYFAGWKYIKNKLYLAVVNSYGKEAGENGIHYMSREVVNYYESLYGTYMFSDLTKEDVQYMIQNGITDRDNWIIQLYKSVITLLKQMMTKKK